MPVVDQVVADGGRAQFLPIDLASLSSVRSATSRLLDQGRPIHLLVNNAGIGMGRGVTEDGFEIHFGVNHLGHFALTGRLAPLLTAGSRVVTVASAAHHNAPGIDFELAAGRTRSLTGWPEYAMSKLANVLFSTELASRHPEWRTYAVHPGLADTGIIPRWVRPFVQHRMISAAEGADTVLWCATADAVSDETGLYYQKREAVRPSPAATDEHVALQLWERSVTWSGQ
jgi:retinol dehydrogenase-12